MLICLISWKIFWWWICMVRCWFWLSVIWFCMNWILLMSILMSVFCICNWCWLIWCSVFVCVCFCLILRRNCLFMLVCLRMRRVRWWRRIMRRFVLWFVIVWCNLCWFLWRISICLVKSFWCLMLWLYCCCGVWIIMVLSCWRMLCCWWSMLNGFLVVWFILKYWCCLKRLCVVNVVMKVWWSGWCGVLCVCFGFEDCDVRDFNEVLFVVCVVWVVYW